MFLKINTRGGGDSKMQEISPMKKIIYWFINDMVVKNYIRIIAVFRPLVYFQITSKIKNPVSIVQTYFFKDEKLTYYLTLKFLVLIVWSNLPG